MSGDLVQGKAACVRFAELQRVMYISQISTLGRTLAATCDMLNGSREFDHAI